MKHIVIWCFVWTIISNISAQTFIPKQNEKGLYGFVDQTGNFVIKPKYDKVHSDFYKGIACVVKGKKYLFINTSGKEISKSYNWASYFDDNDLCLVNAGGKLDEQGNPTGGKYGYIDLKGEERIAVRYAHIGDFNEQGVALINEGGSINKDGDFEGGKNGFVHTSGKILIPPKYTHVGEFTENGLAWVNIGGKYDDSENLIGGKFGYVDQDGIEIIEPKYDFIGPIGEDGICWGNRGGKIFKSDKKIENQIKTYAKKEKDKTKIIAKREELENKLTGGMCDVLKNKIQGGKNGFIDSKGREITKFIYDKASNFYNGVARVMLINKKKEVFGFVNRQGKEITKIEYVEVGEFQNGFTYVKTFPIYDKKKKVNIPSKYGFIDKTGKPLTENKYTWIGKISEGIVACRNEQGFGYINNTGREIIPFILQDAKPFQEGIAFIKLPPPFFQKKQIGKPLSVSISYPWVNRIKSLGKADLLKDDTIAALVNFSSEGKYGAIDSNGIVLINFQYSDVGKFTNNIAPVKSIKWGCINKNGKTIIDCKYEEVRTTFDNQIISVKNNSFWGGVNLKGEVVIPIEFDSFEDFSDMLQDYIKKGRETISARDMEIYRIHKKNLTEHFNIISTIPNEYWDY